MIPEKTENISPSSGLAWIYERPRAIYSTTWQKEKCVYITTQLYLFDGGECKQLGLCIFIQGTHTHTQSKVFICLADHWVDINSPCFIICGTSCLEAVCPSLSLSLKFCRHSKPELSVADGSASIWSRSLEWVFSLQAFWRQFPGQRMEINHWLKHQIREEQSVIVCVYTCICVYLRACICLRLLVHAALHASVCVCSCLCVMEDYRSYRANTSVGPLARHACSMVILPSVCLSSQ